MMNKPVIEFKDFSFQYYSQQAPTLYDIDLKIYPGEKILIVGPSGSGKSTLGHCLNGLIPFYYKGPITGELLINDNPTKDLDIFKLSKIIGTVLQDSDGQFVGLTVGEDIAFSMENDCVQQGEMKDRVKTISKMVGMHDHLPSSPYELSGGQKQRTALAGIMIDDVDVLLFDEPLANLDPATGKQAIEIIDDIHNDSNKTIIIIEHRLEDVLYKNVDRIIVINDGRIIADDSPHKIVASKVLYDNGIREPLYVTAMKYAGLDITPDMKPAYMNTLDLQKSDKKAVKDWYKSIDFAPIKNNNDSILKMEDITFAYEPGKNVIENINIDVKKGEMLSIIGKNGAGKSTISKVLCGFEKQDKGVVYFAGKDIVDKSIKERAELVGVVMQNPNQMISQNLIYDEIALGLRLRNFDEQEIDKRIRKVLKISGLSPFIKWPISALSYGQKKRVTIASILVLEPDIIILDEPTAGQDYRHYTEIMEFLLKINKTGTTVIMITHDMHLMLEYTPRAIVLADARIVKDSQASVVLTNHEIIEKANLKETSLYQLANIVGISDETRFVQRLIDYEREVVR
jgi:energy-coupling factor transport system ATP-binding protein